MPDYSLGTAEGVIKISYDGNGITQASRGLKDFDGRAQDAGRSLSSVATTTGVAAAAIAAGIGLAVNSAIDFEEQISAIGAVTGAAADDMEKLRQKALQLGADTSFSAREAAVAMEELAKAGVSLPDILNGAADAAVALAAAGGVALPEAASIASNAMNVFGLKAKDLGEVVDYIAGAANASAIDVHDFGTSLAQAGAVANLQGVKFEDLATAIALMGNAGIKGSDAGTSLKTMLSNLQPTTKKQIELMKELGIVTENGSNKFYDAKGNLKSLSEVSGILNDSTKKLTAQQRALALETIFGSDAIRAAAVFAKAGSKGFDELNAAINGISAADVAKKRLDNVSGSIDMLKGSVETAAIAFGTALLPTIRKVTDFITMLVNKFSALDPKWQKLIAFAAVAGAALLGLIAVIAAVGATIAAMAASIIAIKVGAIIAGIVLAIIAIATALKLAYDRSEEFRNLIAKMGAVAKAIFGAILAIVKPIVAFFKNDLIPAVKEIAENLKKNLAPAFKTIGDFIQTRVLPGVERLKEAFIKVMPTLIGFWKFILAVAKVLVNVLGKAIGFIVPLLAKILGPVFSFLIDVIANVIEFIPKLVSGFKTFLNILLTVGKFIGIAIIAPFYAIYVVGKWVFEQLMKAVMVFVDAFMAVWDFIFPVVKVVFELIAAVVGLAFDIIMTLFQVFWTGVTTVWNALWAYVLKPVAKAMGVVWGVLKAAFGIILDIISAAWEQIKVVWNFLWEWIVQPTIEMFKKIASFIGDRMEEAKKTAKMVWDAIVGFFKSAKDQILKNVQALTEFVTKIREHFANAKKAATDKLTELIDFVKSLPGKIVSALGNIGSALYNSGKSMIQGFWDGMKAIWNSMMGWVESQLGKLRDLWPFSPAKDGPFSGHGWVLYSGRAVMEGFAEGMNDRVGAVTATAKRALAGVAAALPKDFSATVAASQVSTGMGAGIGSSGGAGSSAANSGTTTTNTINLNVPLEDLRSIKDVQDLLDFIDRLRNDSRRGIEVSV